MMGAWCWPPSMQGLTAGWAQEARIRIIWGLSRCNELAAGPKWMLARPALPSALLLTIWGMHGVQANVHEWGIPGQGRLHPQASHPPVCSGYQIRAVKSRTIRIPSLTWWRMFTGPDSTFISLPGWSLSCWSHAPLSVSLGVIRPKISVIVHCPDVTDVG